MNGTAGQLNLDSGTRWSMMINDGGEEKSHDAALALG